MATGLLEDIEETISGIINIMNSVGIVPEEAEIGCSGFEPCEGLDHLVRVGDPCWIGILRDTEHPFDGGVGFNERGHHLHIRTFVGEADRDHLNAEMLEDGEMPVIPGNRTEKGDLFFVFPGPVATRYTIQHGLNEHIIHHIETGVPSNKNKLRGNVQNP